MCKRLHGEETPVYRKSFNRWKAILFAGKVRKFLQELQQIRDAREHRAHGDFIQGEINYFTDDKQRMRYDISRAARLPIGSGTIESSCKNVIGGRMEQGGTSKISGPHWTRQRESTYVLKALPP